jgi:uncharacterized RDD family membrane protein YckC
VAARSGSEVADPGQRLLARIIDLLLVGVPLALVAQGVLPSRTATVVESVGLAGLVLVYDTVLHARWGRTLGKRLVGVRVVTVGGEPVGMVGALLRAVVFAAPIAARPVPVLGLVAGICWVAGVALVLRPEQDRRASHDLAAGTKVIPDS